MSLDSGAYFVVSVDADAPQLLLLQALLDHGWTPDDAGGVCYLPLGDGDRFAWQHRPAGAWATVRAILGQKAEAGELIGVVLTWQASGVGGEFLLYPDGRVTLSASIHRPTVGDGVTDVTWYLERLRPALHHPPRRVLEGWSWKEW